MRNQIKKATGKVASLIKLIQNFNFKTEQEIIKAYKLSCESDYYQSRRLQKRLEYYFQLFELEEGFPWGELTDKDAKQYEAIWKLVELEEGLNE
jgi:hypothetical protein